MKYLKDLGFVIKRINYSDCDKYITLFTRDNGKIEVIAKGVRKINSRRSFHIELLNLVEFQTVRTKTNYILTDIEVLDSFSQIRQSYEKIGTIFLICELVNKLCADGVIHEDIFHLVKQTLNEIKENDNLSLSLFNFQTQLLTLLGFWSSKRKFANNNEIDRFIENVIEKKIRTKLFFRLQE